MNKDEIKYFIYLRKSSEPEGRQVLSIPGQIERTDEIRNREKLNTIETIIDARSAMRPFNRPQFTDMINRIKKGEASGIILWTIDRLARNSLEWGLVMYLLQTGAIKSIWTTEREYLPKDSILLLALQSSMATQYSIDLSEKVRNGQDQKAREGRASGYAKLGYLNTKLATHGTNEIIVDPERWETVRVGFDLVLSRQYTVAQVADILNNQYSLRSRLKGRPIHKSILYRIFTDPFYYGYFNHRGKIYKGIHKPMITAAEFDEIQGILGRKGKPKRHSHTYAFTGLIKCDSCFCAITATKVHKRIKATGENKTYIFYHCTKRRGVCPYKHYLKEEQLQSIIEKELKEFHLDKDFGQLAIEMLQADQRKITDKLTKQVNEVELQEQKLKQELDILLDMRLSGSITEEKFLEKQSLREEQLIRIDENKQKLNNDIDYHLNESVKGINFMMTALDLFKNGTADERKKVCLYFGHNWELSGEKLIIHKPKWFLDIQNFKNAVLSDYEPTQQKLTYEKYRLKSSFEIANLSLRSLRDDITTEPPK
jgi:site-specific DNA recombinase